MLRSIAIALCIRNPRDQTAWTQQNLSIYIITGSSAIWCHSNQGENRQHGGKLGKQGLYKRTVTNFNKATRSSGIWVFLLLVGVEWSWVHLVRRPLFGVLYQPRMTNECETPGWMRADRGNRKYSEKTCTIATLSPANSIWPDLGSNPGRRGGMPATNLLSYDTAFLLL
jgi:hypothetical protein